MKYALIENGTVTNTIALLPYNASDFPNAIDTGERPVQIGDTYDGERFYRDGKEVHTEVEEKDITIDRMNAAGAEAMQSLNAEPPVSAGVFTYGEWKPDTWYEAFTLFNYEGIAYFTRQAFKSSAVYPPDALGVESLYGARPSPDSEGIYPYVCNMRVTVGMRVRSEKDGNVYVAIQAADPLLYDPVDAVSVFALE